MRSEFFTFINLITFVDTEHALWKCLDVWNANVPLRSIILCNLLNLQRIIQPWVTIYLYITLNLNFLGQDLQLTGHNMDIVTYFCVDVVLCFIFVFLAALYLLYRFLKVLFGVALAVSSRIPQAKKQKIQWISRFKCIECFAPFCRLFIFVRIKTHSNRSFSHLGNKFVVWRTQENKMRVVAGLKIKKG